MYVLYIYILHIIWYKWSWILNFIEWQMCHTLHRPPNMWSRFVWHDLHGPVSPGILDPTRPFILLASAGDPNPSWWNIYELGAKVCQRLPKYQNPNMWHLFPEGFQQRNFWPISSICPTAPLPHQHGVVSGASSCAFLKMGDLPPNLLWPFWQEHWLIIQIDEGQIEQSVMPLSTDMFCS